MRRPNNFDSWLGSKTLYSHSASRPWLFKGWTLSISWRNVFYLGLAKLPAMERAMGLRFSNGYQMLFVFFCLIFLPGRMKKSLLSSSKETVRPLTLMSWKRSSKFYQITLRSVTNIKILFPSTIPLHCQTDRWWEQRKRSIRVHFLSLFRPSPQAPLLSLHSRFFAPQITELSREVKWSTKFS